MLSIVGSLLGGWILSLFGFKGLVVAGMSQLFGVTIGSAGYYTMFGLLGMARSVGYSVNGGLKMNFQPNQKKQGK